MNAFQSLAEAFSSDFHADRDGVLRAMRAAQPEALAQAVLRYECAGLLDSAVRRHALAPDIDPAVTVVVQHATQAARARSILINRQLDDVFSALLAAHIDVTLLDGAARQYAGEPEAHLDLVPQIELLVRREERLAAIRALRNAGYRRVDGGLSKLVPRGPGVPVEVRIALGAPGKAFYGFGWDRMAPYLRVIEGPAGPARVLNLSGTALQRALCGAGLAHLHDLVLLARLLRVDPLLPAALSDAFASIEAGAVEIAAAVVFAARMAGVPVACDREVEHYVRWATYREGLPEILRRFPARTTVSTHLRVARGHHAPPRQHGELQD